MEEKLESSPWWADAIQRARECRRIRNLAKIADQIEKEQRAFSCGLELFVNVVANEREIWEQITVEALEIRRLMDRLEKYVLPYRNALAGNRRRQSLKVLAGIKERRQLLAKVYALNYEDAARKRSLLSGIGNTYAKLRNSDLVFDLDSPDDQGENVPVPIQKLT